MFTPIRLKELLRLPESIYKKEVYLRVIEAEKAAKHYFKHHTLQYHFRYDFNLWALSKISLDYINPYDDDASKFLVTILIDNYEALLDYIPDDDDIDFCVYHKKYKALYIFLGMYTPTKSFLQDMYSVTSTKNKPLVAAIILDRCNFKVSDDLTPISNLAPIPDHFREYDPPQLPLEIWAKIAKYSPKVFYKLCLSHKEFSNHARENELYYRKHFYTQKTALIDSFRIVYHVTPNGALNGPITLQTLTNKAYSSATMQDNTILGLCKENGENYFFNGDGNYTQHKSTYTFTYNPFGIILRITDNLNSGVTIYQNSKSFEYTQNGELLRIHTIPQPVRSQLLIIKYLAKLMEPPISAPAPAPVPAKAKVARRLPRLIEPRT